MTSSTDRRARFRAAQDRFFDARIAAFADLPTVAEQGYPGFEISNMYNLWVPSGTPASIIENPLM